jgi:CheY-like chemotaxis protein
MSMAGPYRENSCAPPQSVNTMIKQLGIFTSEVTRVAREVGTEGKLGVDGASLHVALLDINLRGEMVYPVAARLRERGVPFIFMTGYAPEGVSKEFNDAPILKKPVDQMQLYQTIQRVTEIATLN